MLTLGSLDVAVRHFPLGAGSAASDPRSRRHLSPEFVHRQLPGDLGPRDHPSRRGVPHRYGVALRSPARPDSSAGSRFALGLLRDLPARPAVWSRADAAPVRWAGLTAMGWVVSFAVVSHRRRWSSTGPPSYGLLFGSRDDRRALGSAVEPQHARPASRSRSCRPGGELRQLATASALLAVQQHAPFALRSRHQCRPPRSARPRGARAASPNAATGAGPTPAVR